MTVSDLIANDAAPPSRNFRRYLDSLGDRLHVVTSTTVKESSGIHEPLTTPGDP